MKPDPDLAEKLKQKKANEAHRRQRAIQQFSHRVRFAALIVIAFFFFLGFIFFKIQIGRQQQIFGYLMYASLLAGWAYMVALPLLFGYRTTLWAYVFEKHWVWLSMGFGLPLDIFLLPAIGETGSLGVFGRIPLAFFSFLIWGFFRRGSRRRAFKEETDEHHNLWTRLLTLGILDIAFLGFWKMNPSQAGTPPSANA